jgi:hypothetical protein
MCCTCTQKYGNTCKVLYGNTVPAFQPSNHSAGVTVFGEWLCGSMVVQMFPFHFWFLKNSHFGNLLFIPHRTSNTLTTYHLPLTTYTYHLPGTTYHTTNYHPGQPPVPTTHTQQVIYHLPLPGPLHVRGPKENFLQRAQRPLQHLPKENFLNPFLRI